MAELAKKMNVALGASVGAVTGLFTLYQRSPSRIFKRSSGVIKGLKELQKTVLENDLITFQEILDFLEIWKTSSLERALKKSIVLKKVSFLKRARSPKKIGADQEERELLLSKVLCLDALGTVKDLVQRNFWTKKGILKPT